MHNERLLMALPLAALFAAVVMHSPAHAAGQDGLVAVRDRETGQLRQPTGEEMRALAPAPAAGVGVKVPLSSLVVTMPNGARKVQLGDRAQVYSVVSRTPEGKLAQQCVKGEAAAARALAQPATDSHNQEPRHEDR